ncbi:RRQRL motif-containing zinc-binding protein [Actinopolymorpha sp. B17G11]|uniref:RRQRL motif-containing zinc-binding protein n=1 Tax=Actinopolymorpha sp. B17G11 TaxID=3160861 RepID=UPI0032E530D2
MIQLSDGRQAPGRWICGLPAFRYGWAPDGLATRRQLRAEHLSPGGHEPYALLLWRRDRAFAWLYRLDLAQPARTPTPAQQAALTRAMAARRWCAGCQQHADHCVAPVHRTVWRLHGQDRRLRGMTLRQPGVGITNPHPKGAAHV